MKITTIAIALSTIMAGMSGSAMAAWTSNGPGSAFEMGGELSPLVATNPWEVNIGDPLAINGDIVKGAKEYTETIKDHTLIMAIRANSSVTDFAAPQASVSPQITFGGQMTAIDKGFSTLTLDAMSEDGSAKIGVLTAKMFMKAQAVKKLADGTISRVSTFAAAPGDAFYGGLSTQNDSLDSYQYLDGLGNVVPQSYKTVAGTLADTSQEVLNTNGAYSYNAVYAAGFDKGSTFKITTDNPVNAEVKWKASFPVTVSYM